jgi:hypothetical protein
MSPDLRKFFSKKTLIPPAESASGMSAVALRYDKWWLTGRHWPVHL